MDATAELAPALETEIAWLVRLYRDGRYAQALDGARALFPEFPYDRDLPLMAAQCLRQLGQAGEAMAMLDRLEQHHPRFSQLHQERGLCHLARNDAPRAIAAFALAVDINSSLPISWRNLKTLYEAAGDAAKAQDATRHIVTMRGFPPEVVGAASLLADGDVVSAESIIRSYLKRGNAHPEAWRILGKIAMERGLLDEAERWLKAVLEQVPDHRSALFDYALTLTQQHKYRELDVRARYLLECEPDNKFYMSLAAAAAIGLDEKERAAALCQPLLAALPNSADMRLWLANELRNAGQIANAITVYRAALEVRPDLGNAYWSLANLKTYRFSDEEIAQMRKAENTSGVGGQDRIYLCFALGKALEDRGTFSEAWTYYTRGNALKRAEGRYWPDDLEKTAAHQAQVCTPDFFSRRSGWGADQPDPIFIVGLPRSGSTLLEQILASHSQVDGTQEIADIQITVRDLGGKDRNAGARYPAILAYMTQDEFRGLGEKYLAATQAYRTGRPFFIDKMPNNFRDIGLIHLMLPNARIIDARREPMSCCFSNFKQLFGYGQKFTYDLVDIARYYRSYLEQMRHWDRALPGRILRVHHEDVINDLEGSVRRILDYCGLEFEQSCVDFHKTKRSVRTPSSEQVRQPIFRDGLDQWKNFEPWLGPLEKALGDVLTTYRD